MCHEISSRNLCCCRPVARIHPCSFLSTLWRWKCCWPWKGWSHMRGWWGTTSWWNSMSAWEKRPLSHTSGWHLSILTPNLLRWRFSRMPWRTCCQEENGCTPTSSQNSPNENSEISTSQSFAELPCSSGTIIFPFRNSPPPVSLTKLSSWVGKTKLSRAFLPTSIAVKPVSNATFMWGGRRDPSHSNEPCSRPHLRHICKLTRKGASLGKPRWNVLDSTPQNKLVDTGYTGWGFERSVFVFRCVSNSTCGDECELLV